MLSPAIASHIFGAVVFSVVSFGLIIDRTTRHHQRWLIVSCFITALWAVSTAALTNASVEPKYIWVSTLSILRNLCWCMTLIHLLKQAHFARNAWWFSWHFQGGILGSVSLLYIMHALSSSLGVIWAAEQMNVIGLYVPQVVLSALGLILTEQLFRNTKHYQRPQIALLCLGLGGLLGFDFYLYSTALLTFNMDVQLWQARGGVAGIVAPLIAVMGMYHQQWAKQIAMSQAMAYRPIMAVMCASYLVLISIVSAYIRAYDTSLTEVLQVIFLTSSVIGLLLLLSSRVLRARLKHSINRNFFRYRYDYREEWSRFSAVLSRNSQALPLAESVVMSLATMVDARGGALFEVNPTLEGYTQKVVWGDLRADMVSTRLPSELIAYLENTARVIDCHHVSAEYGLPNRAVLSNWFEEQPWLWLMVPLMQDAKLHAVVLLSDALTELELNWEVFNLLKTAGNQAAVCLAQQQIADQLAEARQFEGFNRLSAFMMHDLKNLVTQLSLITKNAEKQRDNPEFVDAVFSNIKTAVGQMEQMIRQLRTGKANNNDTPFDCLSSIHGVVQTRSAHSPQPDVIVETGNEIAWVLGNANRFSHVLTNIIENAQDATPDDGRINIVVRQQGQSLFIIVTDTGQGMTRAFIENDLFKPFVTTKKNAGMGIGMFEAREYFSSIGGKLSVESIPNQGTTVIMNLPLTVIKEKKEIPEPVE